MIPLGLRLVVNGGREAITRLVILTVAVGLGVGLLLSALAATNAVSAWSSRYAWQWTGTVSVPAGPAAGVAPLWWHPSGDTFDGQQISRYDVAATGASSPVPPGIPDDPAPGQYYASPALAALLRSTPADQLADRYPGRLAGTIGDAGLPSPSSLILIVGRTRAQLAATPFSVRVTSIPTALPGSAVNHDRRANFNASNPGNVPVVNPAGLYYSPPEGQIPASTSDLILSVVALAILAPVLIFIMTATRLSAARREQRFAAMRLAGATRRQISLLAAVESTAGAVLGVALGFGIFFLLRVPVAGIPFIGQPFFPAELTLSLTDVLLVALGGPAAAAVAARLALRRVRISPLGVARRVTPRPPRAWRVLPLLAGFADLGFFVAHGKPASPAAQVQAFVPGYLLIIVGLVIAGPWLTMAAARVMARSTSRPATLIAARRLADDPRAAFRAVSGLVLALLITTAAVVAIVTQDSVEQTKFGSGPMLNLLTNEVADQQFSDNYAPTPGATTGAGPAASAGPLAARLTGIPGVHGVMVVRDDPGLSIPGSFHGLGGSPPTPISAGVVSCAQLATVTVLGRCPAGATAAAFPADGVNGPLFGLSNLSSFVWPAVNIPATRLDRLPVDAVSVATDGSLPTVERARTELENAYALTDLNAPATIDDLIVADDSTNNDYQQLANVVILVSLVIAGCTLAAGIAAGLADRKRPFSLLRLTGARLSTLRGVVALEGAVPLLTVAAVAIGAGFGGAEMNASLQQGHSITAPGADYYLITAGGILLALGVIAATFPLLTRITGPEAARNE
ncbi:MAG TPA: FtsX-like permease family protein [Trebonia sp.]|nr:FtsX-like permease family protein [Trebonia sp.]